MAETMDLEFLIETVKSTTRDVFSTMLMMEADPQEMRAEGSAPGPTDGVVGIIGIAGSWVGTGIIICCPELACRASGAMLMSEYATVNDDVLDAMGEITNMIIGNTKTVLEERYGPMGISVPTVVYGRNFATRTVSRGEWVIVCFSVGGQILQVHLNLAANPAESNHRIVPGFRRTEAVLA